MLCSHSAPDIPTLWAWSLSLCARQAQYYWAVPLAPRARPWFTMRRPTPARQKFNSAPPAACSSSSWFRPKLFKTSTWIDIANRRRSARQYVRTLCVICGIHVSTATATPLPHDALQHTATHCNCGTLQRTATHCYALCLMCVPLPHEKNRGHMSPTIAHRADTSTLHACGISFDVASICEARSFCWLINMWSVKLNFN